MTEMCECLCGCEALTLWRDPDIEGAVELAIWYSYSGSNDWRFRLRCIWKVLTTGTPFSDHILLGKEDALKLSDALRGEAQFDVRKITAVTGHCPTCGSFPFVYPVEEGR